MAPVCPSPIQCPREALLINHGMFPSGEHSKQPLPIDPQRCDWKPPRTHKIAPDHSCCQCKVVEKEGLPRGDWDGQRAGSSHTDQAPVSKIFGTVRRTRQVVEAKQMGEIFAQMDHEVITTDPGAEATCLSVCPLPQFYASCFM